MQDGARLFACGAFGDSVSLTSTVGGDLQCLVLRAPVSRAVAHELLACADALEPDNNNVEGSYGDE